MKVHEFKNELTRFIENASIKKADFLPLFLLLPFRIPGLCSSGWRRFFFSLSFVKGQGEVLFLPRFRKPCFEKL